MFIETIFDFIDFMRPEGQSGYITPERKQEAINYAQFEKFNKEKGKYGMDQDVTDRLRVFERRTELIAQGGYWAMPTDYARAIAFYHKDDTEGEIEGRIIPHGKWGSAKRSKIDPPLLTDPIMVVRNLIEVLPDGVVPVLYYLKQPASVVYNYTEIDSFTIAFTASGSTDIEWPESEHPEIITKALQFLGVPLKDDILIQFEQFKQQQRVIDGRS